MWKTALRTTYMGGMASISPFVQEDLLIVSPTYVDCLRNNYCPLMSTLLHQLNLNSLFTYMLANVCSPPYMVIGCSRGPVEYHNLSPARRVYPQYIWSFPQKMVGFGVLDLILAQHIYGHSARPVLFLFYQFRWFGGS